MNEPLITLLSSRPGAAALPSVDRLLALGDVRQLVDAYGREQVYSATRALLDEKRHAIVTGAAPETIWAPGEEWVVRDLAQRLEQAARSRLRAVFNLTGTVLHTNLGRALMPDQAIEAVGDAMRNAVNLEYDIGSGERGDRDHIVERWLTRLTGAEAATVVNNNAAAVLLALNSLARGKQTIVSRGELIEIGGAFRMPDIMARAGTRLVEVGTTNRTHLRDYEQAIGAKTAMLMKVHASNYAIAGFTAAVAERELADLAHAKGLPLVVDLGSGSLIDLARWGLPREPTPQQSLAAGADLVTFSGDKLLGGPQAGLMVGRSNIIARLRTNPLKRALRVDKMTLAALDAVLRLYLDPDRLRERVTTLRLLTRPQDELLALGRRLVGPVQAALADRATVDLRECQSQIGSGSLPVERLPSAALVLTPLARGRGAGTALRALEKLLRDMPIPVLGRAHDGALWLDLRCLEDETGFRAQVASIYSGF